MLDYRLPENRREYFTKLYTLNLDHGIMPGLVYLYMPALKQRLNWDDDTALWFAFLNGMTQNPLTSLRLFEQLPEPPQGEGELARFEAWFNDNWNTLQFDTDRRYQKKETVHSIRVYCTHVVRDVGQPAYFSGKTYKDLWHDVAHTLHSFGRLSSFSYLEYVKIMGYGTDCTDLMFYDRSGSKSHRNGCLFLCGMDELVDDKRANNGFDGNYPQFKEMCEWLEDQAYEYLCEYRMAHPHQKYATNYTLESQFCQFKNGFFRRRYPGIYSDMAFDRLEWYESNVGKDKNSRLIWEIRESLPNWLRNEYKNDRLTWKQRAAVFMDTGQPYRAEYFL